jgi:beta-glucanase (GH16 family)
MNRARSLFARSLILASIGLLANGVVLNRLTAAPPGNSSSWALVWGDEFNGMSLDPSKWSWGQLPWGGNYHNSSYASVVQASDSYLDGNGHLVLRNRTGTFAGSDGNNHPYSEGFVYSNGKFRYTYGYVEVSTSYPNDANGSLWPAFWTLSDGWPPEFDIAEYWSYGNYMHMALYDNNSTWHTTTLNNEDFGNYHSYGLDWGENYATWYKDGANRAYVGATAVPNQTMYFLLNSGVASSPGPNGSAHFPYYAYLDYVRVYKRTELIYNGDFEAWSGAWNLANNASATGGQGVGGSIAMRLDTGSSSLVNSTASQTVYGLLPNATYVLTGWYHNDSAVNPWWPGVNVAVADTGGGSFGSTAWGGNPNWTQGKLSFATGPIATNANVSVQVQPSWGRVYLDNVLLRRAATVNNAGFETSYLDPHWQKAGNSWLLQYSPRSGLFAAQFHSHSSMWQEVAGLRASTTYQLKAWATGPSWPGLQVTVTNSGGPDASLTIYPSGGYASSTLTFTTGSNSTAATVALVNASQSSDYVYFADDIFLAEPLNPPWQAQDVGAVVLEGASGRRSTSFALEGSGADIWNTSDAFHFVFVPLDGDGAITARVRSFDNVEAYSKVGLMMRETTNANSRHVLINWMPNAPGRGSCVECIARSAPGGTSTSISVTNVLRPPWLRSVRAGDTFTAYYSTDGNAWSPVATNSVSMSASTLVGLVVCSHDTTAMSEGILDNVTVDPSPLNLSAQLSGGSIVLSWPASAFAYALQTSASLSPAAAWSPAGGSPLLTNNQFVVSLPAAAGAAFYFLKR